MREGVVILKRTKLIRFIGIVCWFLALFILISGHQQKKAEEEAAQPAPIVEQMEESGGETDGTVIFPTD